MTVILTNGTELRKLTAFTGYSTEVQGKRIGEWDEYFTEMRYESIDSVKTMYERYGFEVI